MIHPVFHVSLLEPAPTVSLPGRRQPPPPPVVIQDEEEWEVKEIVNPRYQHRRLQYLVEWFGYKDNEFERRNWQPSENLEGSPNMVEEFHRLHPNKPGPGPPPNPRGRNTRRRNHSDHEGAPTIGGRRRST